MRPGLKAVAEEIGAVSSPEADAEDGVGAVLQQQQQLQLYVPLVRHHEADHQVRDVCMPVIKYAKQQPISSCTRYNLPGIQTRGTR